MDTGHFEHVRHRDIRFCSLHPDKRQAHSVMLLLSDIDGMVGVTLVDDHCLQVSYNLTRLSLKLIETALTELGYHLDGSLLSNIKRALYYYTEDIQRANLGYRDDHANNTREIFINRYHRLRHGCRDDRPDHWRKYL